MEFLKYLIDLVLHFDDHLLQFIADYDKWTYLILFLIIFCETGLVVTPILPGDSLLFAAGAFAAMGKLNIALLFFLLGAAAVLGDAVNYAIGNFMGPKVLQRDGRFLKRKYLERTHQFYERYGGKTIILARFVPIVRTFAPFLAGVGSMSYSQFAKYNIAGAVLWISLCLFLGYGFGNVEWVQKNFEVVLLAIVVISVLPAAFEAWRVWRHGDGNPQAAGVPNARDSES
ncbi:MAG TPA: DedA family protein [Pirellulales bacterium]